MLEYGSVSESIANSSGKRFKLYWEVSYKGNDGKFMANRFDMLDDYFEWQREFLKNFIGTIEFFVQRRYECGDEFTIIDMRIDKITKNKAGGVVYSGDNNVIHWPLGEFS